MRILIRGGRVINPASDIDKVQDIYIAEGKILARGRKPQDFTADRVIDASGLVVCPGLVDLRARLREPGQESKGTIASETKAAAKAGVTTVCCPPDTDPVIDTPAVVELIHRRAAEAACANVVPLGALTYRLRGEQLAEMAALKQAGCVGVSNAGRPVDPKSLRRAMEYAASQGLTIYLHAEDPALSQNGCAHEGRVSVRLGLPGIPETAETIAVAQALQLIDLTGVNAHFCGLSSAAAARMIARAQYDGAPITVDVAAHQLFLTEMDIGFFNSQCHVRPPLRTERDRDGLREALVNGTISAICSDHQPHDPDAKLAPFPSTEPGISAIETLLPLTLRLVEEGVLSLPDALSRVTLFPANILDIPAGTLEVGASADICIFHPYYSWRFTERDIVSSGKNTPFLGWNLRGFVTHTLLNGRVVHEVEEARLQDVLTQGAFEAEQAQAVVPVEVEAEEPAWVEEDEYSETQWPEEAAEPQAIEEAPPAPVVSPKGKDKKKTGKKAGARSEAKSEFHDDPREEIPGHSAQPEIPAAAPSEPPTSATPSATNGSNETYKPAFAQFRVPPQQFAPLSDRVIKTRENEDSGDQESTEDD